MTSTKKIDVESGLACHSALNIFTVPPTNISINKSAFRELLPINSIDETPYEFRVFSDSQWIDLSKTYLYLHLQIQKLHQNNWVSLEAADTEVAPIQSIGQSFIRQLKLSINGVDVYNSTNLYPYLSYIKNELSYSDAVKKSALAASGYYDSFTDRVELMELNSRREFMARLDFDLANQNLFLLNNLNLLFTLYKSDDTFLIQTKRVGDNSRYRIRLHSIKLYVKTIDVQNSLNLGVLTMLEKQSAKYPLRRTEIRNCYISQGRTDLTFNVFTNVVPRRLILGMVNNNAFNGTFNTDPFSFQPYNLRSIIVNAGGVVHPLVPYDMDFVLANRPIFMRAFLDMHLSTMSSENTTNGITPEKFLDGWALFVIPLTSTLDDCCGGFELIKSGTTTIYLKFNEVVPAPGVSLIVIGEFDQLLTIDQNRVVMTDGVV